MGAFSHFPHDADQIMSLAEELPDEKPKGYYPYTFRDEAVNEVLYHLIPWFLPVFFPRYQRDRLYNPLWEYLSYIPKKIRKSGRERYATEVTERLRDTGTPYHLVILQMQGDYQVRRGAPFTDFDAMVEHILASFAAHAEPERQLVLKMHPLENNLKNWPAMIGRVARQHGIHERVHVIDGGDLGQLYQGCDGVVLLNSTAGLTALTLGVPVKVLGVAIYDMARLTHQGDLQTFWTAPDAPERAAVQAFIKLLIASVQVKGNFFTKEGRGRAVPEFARRLIEGDVNGHGAFVDPPPRLARAKALGVPMIYEPDA